MSDPPHPDLRASDADRERAADLLRRAGGDGRLTVDELGERLDAAYAARTQSELDRLTADVVPRAPGRAVETAGAGAPTFSVRREGGEGTRHLVAIMSGVDRAGRWRLARRAMCWNIMGGADLDLNDVELADDDVELTVVSVMGGADIHVPEGLNVHVSSFAFMGGNGQELGDSDPAPGGPVLRLRLISIMGGTDVTRGRKRSRAQRRAERSRAQRRAERRLHRRR
jgi:uncharacterized protein DUF1707